MRDDRLREVGVDAPVGVDVVSVGEPDLVGDTSSVE